METSLLVYLLFLCTWSAFFSVLEVGFCWAQKTIWSCASKQPFCPYKAWSIISSLKHHFGVLTGPRDHSSSTYPDGFSISCTVQCRSQTSMALLCHLTIGFLPWGHDGCWGHAGERTLVYEWFAPAKLFIYCSWLLCVYDFWLKKTPWKCLSDKYSWMFSL